MSNAAKEAWVLAAILGWIVAIVITCNYAGSCKYNETLIRENDLLKETVSNQRAVIKFIAESKK